MRLPTGLYRIANYTFTSDEEDSGFVRSESVDLLRRHFGQEAGFTAGANPSGQTRLYVSRRRSSRSFSNEADVADMMSQRGFAVVYLEELELREQIALFQQAEMIVAPHGAGLSNLLWDKPGTQVIEMFTPRYANDCFARMAGSVQADYIAHWGRPDEGWGSVDLDTLARLVDQAHGPKSVL